MEPVICHADPLLIVHPEDGVQFFGKMDFEFAGTLGDGETGRAVCLKPARDGWTPVLNVQYQVVFKGIFYRPIYRRGGLTFVGEDDEGTPFTWYINEFAEDYVMSLQEGRSPEDLALELQEEMAG